jgi:hypothetical protein
MIKKPTAANFDGSGSMVAVPVLPRGVAQQSVSGPDPVDGVRGAAN